MLPRQVPAHPLPPPPSSNGPPATHSSCPLAARLAALLGKERVGPNIKNLEHNAWEHCLQFILPVVVAIFVYLTRHVTEPPPALLFRDPVLYVSLVQNASGIVMLQFLRHAGLPTMWWHRAARTEDSHTLDDLHALSFHTVRPPPRLPTLPGP